MGVLSRIGSFFRPSASYGTGSGYAGGNYSRRREDKAFRRSLPLDEDRLSGTYGRAKMRLECLDLMRNNPLVAGIVDRFQDHVVGGGIIPQAKTSNPEWNKEAEQFWSEWSKVCDYRQRMNMREIQRAIIRARMATGDCGFVLLKNGQIQPVEAERIATPQSLYSDKQVVDGVVVRNSGIKDAFWIGARDDSGNVSRENFEKVYASDFIHCLRAIRFDQVRGIPDLAPILNHVHDLGRLGEEVLNRAILDALHAWAVYSEEGPSKINQTGPRNVTPKTVEEGQRIEYFSGGQTYYMRPGEKVESLASATPNATLVPFIEHMLRTIGAAIGLPYEFLLLDFKGGSFSASRAALMTTYRTFQTNQTWLVDSFLQRAWNWRIAKAIKNGEISPAPVDARGVSEWYKVRWQFPRHDWIDPLKQVTADETDIRLGVSTWSSVAATRGRDAEDVFIEKAQDISDAIRVAKEISDATGEPISWRDIVSQDPPKDRQAARIPEEQVTQ